MPLFPIFLREERFCWSTYSVKTGLGVLSFSPLSCLSNCFCRSHPLHSETLRSRILRKKCKASLWPQVKLFPHTQYIGSSIFSGDYWTLPSPCKPDAHIFILIDCLWSIWRESRKRE